MRPLWFEFPETASLFAVDDEFMLGPALLAAPVLDEGVQSRSVTLPAGPVWYDAATGATAGPALLLPGRALSLGLEYDQGCDKGCVRLDVGTAAVHVMADVSVLLNTCGTSMSARELLQTMRSTTAPHTCGSRLCV